MAPRSNKDSQQGYLKDYTFAYNRQAQQTEELPSYKLEVKLHHKKKIDIRALQRHLQDMEIHSDAQARIITVIGFPPDNDFDHNSVLEVVQQFDSNATISSFRQID